MLWIKLHETIFVCKSVLLRWNKHHSFTKYVKRLLKPKSLQFTQKLYPDFKLNIDTCCYCAEPICIKLVDLEHESSDGGLDARILLDHSHLETQTGLKIQIVFAFYSAIFSWNPWTIVKSRSDLDDVPEVDGLKHKRGRLPLSETFTCRHFDPERSSVEQIWTRWRPTHLTLEQHCQKRWSSSCREAAKLSPRKERHHRPSLACFVGKSSFNQLCRLIHDKKWAVKFLPSPKLKRAYDREYNMLL